MEKILETIIIDIDEYWRYIDSLSGPERLCEVLRDMAIIAAVVFVGFVAFALCYLALEDINERYSNRIRRRKTKWKATR